MAPTKTVRSKHAISKLERSTGQSGKITKSKPTKGPKLPPPKQQKTKSTVRPTKPKRRAYTEKELGIPKLNAITPVGVELPKGKKKGKVFVDDQESMMTILAIVNANQEGQIESKMMKSRQLEEIREARRKEAEARHQQKEAKMEERKDSLRRKRKHNAETIAATESSESRDRKSPLARLSKKRVSFG
ncbi:MAG: hypothetical protein Q9218_001563 [Villophora microphyllina]